MSEPWLKWVAAVGYYDRDRSEEKEVARIEFWAPSAPAAEEYARRHAEALFGTSWDFVHWRVEGPIS